MQLKDEVILEIQEILLQKADELRKDTKLTPEDKLEKVDVIFNTYKFLQHYEYNIGVLQNNLDKNRYEREI